MKRVKHLPKHLRPRWRYLAVGIEAWPDAELDRGAFQRALWYAAQNLVGDVGSAEADLSVLSFRFADGNGEAVVRVRRGEVDRARAVVACVASVDGDEVGLRVRGTSGTVRACEEKYMGRAPIHPEQRHVEFQGARRSAVVAADRVDVRAAEGYAGATTLDLH
jgi:ribonuclease P/MRP protein subunit POP5